MSKRLCLMVVLLMIVASGRFSPAWAAPEPQFSLGLGVEYARGDFGADSTGNYIAVPLSLTWYANQRLDLELTVPYLYQSSGATGYAATGGGIASARSASGGRGTSRPAAAPAHSGQTEESGLGDISLEGGYNILLDGEGRPDLGLTCYLKFPTAEADQGLGTGSFDWGPGLRLAKWLGEWQPFLEGRYILQGASREETGARDYLFAEAGLGYGWSDQLYLAGFSRFGTASFDGLAAPLEMRLKTVWGFAESNSLELYLAKGFSEGSPDYGVGLSFFTGF
ncbi:MAG: hypothetical protein HGA96_14250 [Desulfobulbaceae bacterium]|nr:hypothetical protein [Desulfobulbaceae bacterium]